MGSLKNLLHAVIPSPIFSAYHFILAWFAAALYAFPSRELMVVGVTGTKGKSSTIEFLNAIFEEAGYKTALVSTIRMKIDSHSEPNLMRMTMGGRFFTQKFLYLASRAGCNIAFIEMTSEGARQHRHRAIELNALIFLNLAPEHIESHGSLQKYANAKLQLGLQLERSHKRPRYMLANSDDAQASRFLGLQVEHCIPFALSSLDSWTTDERGGVFQFDTEELRIHLPGAFSITNALAAATLARLMKIKTSVIARGLDSLKHIPGRAERVEAGQNFTVIVDYAHTPDSLAAIYSAYRGRKICVLGSMGGGRDIWKRPVMGSIADGMCETVILTNEDPCDEDPRSIVEGLARGMKRSPEIRMDRREAIRHALQLARSSDTVLITGKGTDPCIYGPRGTKIPWSDSGVAREELEKLQKSGVSAVV
ncbi:MAG: hypothetical protein G01um10148_129 [Parcubacteria group bacterium Gr01-1014_8]|nr:MAG: hypothetical protein G01um10148_129 [Parcubacteria group bacterium Gr01-1014_8]